MTAQQISKALANAGLLCLVIIFFTRPPVDYFLIGLAVVLPVVALKIRPDPREVASEKLKNEDETDLMTLWDVADEADIPWKEVPRELQRSGVPRADATGWKRRLPVSGVNMLYRRVDIDAWLANRHDDAGSLTRLSN